MSAASATLKRGGSTGRGGGRGAGGAGSTMEIPWGLLGVLGVSWEYWEVLGGHGGRGRPWGCWGATGCHGVLVGQLGVQVSGGSRVGPGSPSNYPAPTISGALTANEGQHGDVTGAHTWGRKPGAGGISWAWTWVQGPVPRGKHPAGPGDLEGDIHPTQEEDSLTQRKQSSLTGTRVFLLLKHFVQISQF